VNVVHVGIGIGVERVYGLGIFVFCCLCAHTFKQMSSLLSLSGESVGNFRFAVRGVKVEHYLCTEAQKILESFVRFDIFELD
jgi:hypothetical protein